MAENPTAAPDFLDQSEIDKLLAQTAESQSPKQQLIRADGLKGGPVAALKVEPFPRSSSGACASCTRTSSAT